MQSEKTDTKELEIKKQEIYSKIKQLINLEKSNEAKIKYLESEMDNIHNKLMNLDKKINNTNNVVTATVAAAFCILFSQIFTLYFNILKNTLLLNPSVLNMLVSVAISVPVALGSFKITKFGISDLTYIISDLINTENYNNVDIFSEQFNICQEQIDDLDKRNDFITSDLRDCNKELLEIYYKLNNVDMNTLSKKFADIIKLDEALNESDVIKNSYEKIRK